MIETPFQIVASNREWGKLFPIIVHICMYLFIYLFIYIDSLQNQAHI